MAAPKGNSFAIDWQQPGESPADSVTATPFQTKAADFHANQVSFIERTWGAALKDALPEGYRPAGELGKRFLIALVKVVHKYNDHEEGQRVLCEACDARVQLSDAKSKERITLLSDLQDVLDKE